VLLELSLVVEKDPMVNFSLKDAFAEIFF